jgi:hypothetical protein
MKWMEVVDTTWHKLTSSNYFHGEQGTKTPIDLITHPWLKTNFDHISLEIIKRNYNIP